VCSVQLVIARDTMSPSCATVDEMDAIAEAAISAVLSPRRLWSLEDVKTRPCPVPAEPGIYGWYFRSIPDDVPVRDCRRHGDRTLLYVGVAPAFVGSNGTLRSRIKTHFRPRGRSTLRRTLGCLLESSLSLRIAKQRGTSSFHYGDTEELITDWMATNAFVVWAECAEPWRLEAEVIAHEDLPLNINHNRRHPFCASLQALRDDARLRVRALP
jgi:GIY-YIG catalytic domain